MLRTNDDITIDSRWDDQYDVKYRGKTMYTVPNYVVADEKANLLDVIVRIIEIRKVLSGEKSVDNPHEQV